MTDHSVLKLALQTKIIEKRSAKLNEWVMFLSIFLSRMTIIHRVGKTHQNVDALFRLFTKSDSKFHICFFIAIVFDENDFLKKIAEELLNDRHFEKLVHKLKQQIEETKDRDENSAIEYQSYRFDDDTELFYFRNRPHSERLCISKKNYKKLFHYEYDCYGRPQRYLRVLV